MALTSELLCLFFLGFLVSSLIGVAVAWALGLHHGEENPLEEGRWLAPAVHRSMA